MKTWRIPVTWEVSDFVKVEANTLAEAIKIAMDEDEVIPLPASPEYVSGSWKAYTDEEYVRDCCNDGQEDE